MFRKDIISITKLIFLIICYFLLQTSFANELKKNNYKKLKEIEGTNKQVLGFAEQMRSLEKILQNHSK